MRALIKQILAVTVVYTIAAITAKIIGFSSMPWVAALAPAAIIYLAIVAGIVAFFLIFRRKSSGPDN